MLANGKYWDRLLNDEVMEVCKLGDQKVKKLSLHIYKLCLCVRIKM